jgi:hypothetical protein
MFFPASSRLWVVHEPKATNPGLLLNVAQDDTKIKTTATFTMNFLMCMKLSPSLLEITTPA